MGKKGNVWVVRMKWAAKHHLTHFGGGGIPLVPLVVLVNGNCG
jgi:hypothetical protein